MKSIHWFAAALALCVGACNFTPEGQCYLRGDSEGAGVGGGVIASGAGPGGGLGDSPSTGSASIPCNASDSKGTSGEGASAPVPPSDGSDLSNYIRCVGLSPVACQEACYNVFAYCNVTEEHPYGSMAGGSGKLKQCQSNLLNYTCTYCYPNGDVCTMTRLKGLPSFWLCSYTGGKGCE